MGGDSEAGEKVMRSTVEVVKIMRGREEIRERERIRK